MSTILFTAWGHEVTLLELIASLTSFIGVWLGTTGKRITWPWWALSSVLYGVFFYQLDYFASAVLQIVFVVAAFYGWKGWAPTGAVAGNLSIRNRMYIAVGVLFSVAFLSPLLANLGAAATWSDAFVLIGSLVAQIMMVYEKFESWVVWLIVDVVATIQYAVNGLFFTSILYGTFTIVAIVGLKRWRGSLRY